MCASCRLKTYAKEAGCQILNPRKRALTQEQQRLYGTAFEIEKAVAEATAAASGAAGAGAASAAAAAADASETLLVLQAPLKFPKAPRLRGN